MIPRGITQVSTGASVVSCAALKVDANSTERLAPHHRARCVRGDHSRDRAERPLGKVLPAVRVGCGHFGSARERQPRARWDGHTELDSMGARCLFPVRVILMSVKEACDPLLQLSCVTRLTHRNRVIKEVPLNLRR